MEQLTLHSVESYHLTQTESPEPIPHNVLNRIYRFLAKYYHVAEQEEVSLLLRVLPEDKAELTVLLGMNDEIAGISQTRKHALNLEHQQITVFINSSYFNTHYDLTLNKNDIGLATASQYAYLNPHEEVIYVGLAHSPLIYELFAAFGEIIHPLPLQQIPEHLLHVVNELKRHNGWISTNDHPLTIQGPLVPIRSRTPNYYPSQSPLNKFYMATNPDYMQGNALLVCVPMNLDRCDHSSKPYFLAKELQH